MESARWWSFRPARSRKAATYVCPFCHRQLHAMSDHLVVAPEGNVERRRHAHIHCVRAEHAAGRFKTYDDWRAEQPPAPGVLARLLRFSRRRG